MEQKLDVYYMDQSPPSRAVLLTARALGLKVNKIFIDLDKGESHTKEYEEMNPEGNVPTLRDGNFVLWESRAILQYLATKYGQGSFYPKDPQQRAIVDRMLYFDIGTLYESFKQYALPVIFEGATKLEPAKLEKLHRSLKMLNGYLDGHDFAVGNSITIADHSLVASVSSIVGIGIDISSYPNVEAWLSRCEKQMIGYQEENGEGAANLGKFMTQEWKF